MGSENRKMANTESSTDKGKWRRKRQRDMKRGSRLDNIIQASLSNREITSSE
jgi:hypothetical protein